MLVDQGESSDRVGYDTGDAEADVGRLRRMIRQPRSRARIAFSALVIGAILFAACGSDDASSDTTDPADTVATDGTATG